MSVVLIFDDVRARGSSGRVGVALVPSPGFPWTSSFVWPRCDAVHKKVVMFYFLALLSSDF